MSMEKQALPKVDVLVVDGSSIINRAYFGIGRNQRLTAPDGTPTGAVYTFFNMLFSYQDKINPAQTYVCFDLSGPTFRHEFFNEYKAGRRPMDEDLAIQFPIVKEGLKYMGITYLEKAGFEADDIIATVSMKAASEGKTVFALSGDRDLWQLISDKITIVYPYSRKGSSGRELLTPDVFYQMFQFTPEKLLDYKALKGDSSDNIPGVKGVGEKTAMGLIQEYGTLDNVYENLENIKGSKRKNLEAGKESAYLSYRLAKLHYGVELDFPPNTSPDIKNLREYFANLNMKSFQNRFGLDEIGVSKPKVPCIKAKSLEEIIQEKNYVYILPIGAKHIALMNDAQAVFIIPIDEIEYQWENLLKNGNQLITWGAKDWIRRFNLNLPEYIYFDAEIAAYLLNHLEQEDFKTAFSYAYGAVTKENLILADIFETENDNTEAIIAEAALRLVALKRLQKLQKELLVEQQMENLANKVEFPLTTILASMEKTGIRLDQQALTVLSEEMGQEIENLQRQIYFYLGEEINLNSSKQLGEILFDKLGLKGGKKTKSGAYSTAASVLEELYHQHPVIPLILDYREVTKLKSTFVDGLKKVVSEDSRIHTTFKQTFTSTGRLSSVEPNLQNIPVKSRFANSIRNLFVASEGKTFIDADYSQIELRLLAELSEDVNLRAAFQNHEDIHASTASRLFLKDMGEVSSKERRDAKTVNFSIVYGISDFGLARDLGTTVAQAKEYIDAYDEHYPMVRAWMHEQVESAKKTGYVETILHRRRYIPELKSKNFHQRKFGERAAMNAPVQGSAADLIKVAMVKVHKNLAEKGLNAKLILQVHDELLLECPDNEVEETVVILKQAMEEAFELTVPILVDIGIGKSWGNIEEV